MAVDVEAIVGKANMTIGARPQVVEILRLLQDTPTTKRYLYARWLRLLGYRPKPGQLDEVAPWGQH